MLTCMHIIVRVMLVSMDIAQQNIKRGVYLLRHAYNTMEQLVWAELPITKH